ncbi:hypothetical protein U0070_001223, partial [Myodes glareolus]
MESEPIFGGGFDIICDFLDCAKTAEPKYRLLRLGLHEKEKISGEQFLQSSVDVKQFSSASFHRIRILNFEFTAPSFEYVQKRSQLANSRCFVIRKLHTASSAESLQYVR